MPTKLEKDIELYGNFTWLKAPCECKICSNSFRSLAVQESLSLSCYNKALTDAQARSIAANHLQNINQDLTYLRGQWLSHGKIITSRWKKFSRDKRTGYLKNADPDLFQKQWFAPMFSSSELGSPDQLEARKYRNVILLDYLTIDGLKDDATRLLGLLQNRTLHRPEEWAAYDNQKLTWGWRLGHFDIDASNLCMVMYGPRYGEMVEWESRAAHAEEIVGFPRARVVLEAQETLLKFLRRMVEQLVDGIKDPDPAQASLPPFIVELRRKGRLDQWSSYTNQPFSSPPFFDINDMLGKAVARKNMIGDHLWLLQTDPAYLRQAIHTAAEIYPQGHPPQDIHGTTVGEIHLSIWSYWSWVTIAEACGNVRAMQVKFRDSIHPGLPLPPKYEQVLQELELLLDCQLRIRLDPLPMMLGLRPGFKKHFKYDYSVPNGIDFHGDIKLAQLFSQDPLFFILHILPINPDSHEPQNFDPAMKWSFLEDHISNNKVDSSRLDEFLYERYTNFAATQELFASIHRHVPMPSLLMELDSFEPEKAQDLGRPTVLRHQIERITDEYYMCPYDQSGTVPLMIFSKAFDGHLTKAERNDQMRLKQFDDTRAALGVFWSLTRRKRQMTLKGRGKVWSSEDIHEDLKLISADLETTYQNSVAAERQKIVDRIELSHLPPGKQEAPQTEWGSTPSSGPKSSGRSKKTKVAKHPEQLPDIEKLVVKDCAEKTGTAKPIQVRDKTRQIFQGMFSTAEPTKKPIDWEDFVVAMQDVGFKSQQTTGSEVVFQPGENERGWSGRINFHRPHPVPKIDRIMMRVMGKRMNRWYGWEDGLFVVEEK